MKIAVVTGSAGNLGRSISEVFLANGYTVYGTLMKGESFVPSVYPENFFHVELDLVDESACGEFISGLIKKHGSIDVAVMTAGGFSQGDMSSTRTADIAKQIRVNFDTTYSIARPVFAQMKKQRTGRIFMIGSKSGLHSSHANGMVAYSIAKSMLFRLADIMNDEAKGMNVVASVVIPSTIDTEQNRRLMPDADFNAWVKSEEIAGIILFHSSPEARSLRETIVKVYGNC